MSTLKDTFTDTDGTLLQAHTGESGGWTKASGSAGEASITSGKSHASASSAAIYVWTNNLSTNDQSCTVTYVKKANLTGGANVVGVIVRGDAEGKNLYRLHYDSEGKFVLSKRIEGTFTVLKEETIAVPTENEENTLKLEAKGTTLKCYKGNTMIYEVTDSSVASGGHPGIFFSRGESSVKGFQADSLEAADLAESVIKSPVTLFGVFGQSNASGRGNSAESAVVPTNAAFEFKSSEFKQLTDPVEGSETGSSVPALGKRYNELTGAQVVASVLGPGGCALVAAAETESHGNWSPTGTKRATAKNQLKAAKEALEGKGITPKVAVFWVQGERDAQSIDEAVITKAEYKSGLEGIIAYFRTNFGSQLPFYISRTGRKKSGDSTGFQQVRAAQEEVAAADPLTKIVFKGALNFPTEGKMNPETAKEELHYSQAGYNQMGAEAAEAIFAIENPSSGEKGSFHKTAVNEESFIRGAARLLWAGLTISFPTKIGEVINLSTFEAQAGWNDLGATKNGISITLNNSEEEFDVDQVLGPISTQPTGWECTVGTQLAEFTEERMQIAWEGSSIVTEAGEKELGVGQPTSYTTRRLAVLFQRPNGKIRGYFFRRGNRSASESSFTHAKTGEQISLPVTWKMLADPSISEVRKAFFTIRDQI